MSGKRSDILGRSTNIIGGVPLGAGLIEPIHERHEDESASMDESKTDAKRSRNKTNSRS